MKVELLACLVVPETDRSPSTLHDDGRAQTTENIAFVLLTGIEIGDDNIFLTVQTRVADRAAASSPLTLRRSKLEFLSAFEAEYVAIVQIASTTHRFAKRLMLHTHNW